MAKTELPAFMKALSAYDGEPRTKLALELLMLTFVRTGEAALDKIGRLAAAIAHGRCHKTAAADAAGAPNVLWVADITYIPTRSGFLYLANPSSCYTI